MKENKVEIPLFPMLSAIDLGDKDFYANLLPEQKKVFSAWTTMRWASNVVGNNMEHYLLMINGLVNHEFTSLSAHPELQWKLIVLCGVGCNQKHTWIQPPRRASKHKMQSALNKLYPMMKADEVELMEKIYTKEEIETLFKDSGYSDEELKELF